MSIYIQVCMHPLVFFFAHVLQKGPAKKRISHPAADLHETALFSGSRKQRHRGMLRSRSHAHAIYHHRAVGMSWAQTQPCAYIDRMERVEERELARIKEETSREKVKKVGFSKFFPQACFYSHIQTHAYLYTHADKFIHTRNAYIQLHKHTDMYAHTYS